MFKTILAVIITATSIVGCDKPVPIFKTTDTVIALEEDLELQEQIIRKALRMVGAKKRPGKEEDTLYDTYSKKELDLLFRVVEAEAMGADVECKSHVASVIFNRLEKGWWDGDITRSLMAHNQYEVVSNGRYKRVTVTESTIQACEVAFNFDTARGALFFDSTDGKSWAAKNREFIFRDRIGHDFFK